MLSVVVLGFSVFAFGGMLLIVSLGGGTGAGPDDRAHDDAERRRDAA